MAKSQPRTYSNGRDSVKFIDLTLSGQAEKALKSAKEPKPQWLSAYSNMIADGWKFTLKEDSRNHSVMAMLQRADYDPNERTVIYVLRSGTAEGAMLKLAWYYMTAEGTLPDPDAALENEADEDDLFS